MENQQDNDAILLSDTLEIKPLSNQLKKEMLNPITGLSAIFHLFPRLWKNVYWINLQNTVITIHYCPSTNQHTENFIVVKEVY